MSEITKNYDLIVVGAGPAGLSASVYASRYGVNHLVLGEMLGGQISETHLIDNYLGIENTSGFEFAQRLGNHAKKYGTQILSKRVVDIQKKEDFFEVRLSDGERLKARSVFLGTGMIKRKLSLPDEEKLLGKGVSYCATCDGFFYKEKTVAVVGGGDSAVAAAVFLGNIAKKVFIIYRKDTFRAEKHWVEMIKDNPKMEVLFNSRVIGLEGEEKLEKLSLLRNEKKKKLEVDGLFIEIGSVPSLDYAPSLALETDEEGFIKIGKSGETSLPGVWAGGDITDGSDKFCQVVTAASEGAIAARSIFKYLKKNNAIS